MHTLRRKLILLLIVLLVGLGCACPLTPRLFTPATPSPAPTAEPTDTAAPSAMPTASPPPVVTAVPTDADILRGIQDTMDTYARAYNQNDLELLLSVVDTSNAPFRRMVKSRFDDYQASMYAGTLDFSYEVVSIQRRGPLAVAHLRSFDVVAADWPFRLVNGTWLLSEPAVEELGELVTSEDEHFIFETYPWADDVNFEIMEMLDMAARQVYEKLGGIPTQKLRVRIRPSYSIDRFADPNSIAYYQPGTDLTSDAIYIYAPNSVAFDTYYEADGWQAGLQQTITHEYTHFAHQRAFDNAGKLLGWLGEGLAEYASDSSRIYAAFDAARQDQLIPLVDPSDEVYKQDLMHLYLLEADMSLGYAESHALVEYIVFKYGGIDTVWELARTHDDLQDLDAALQNVLGVGLDEFENRWQKWMKAQH